MQTQTPTTPFRDIPITALVESRWNPRKHFRQDTLDELAASIREVGVIEPIVVRPNGTPETFEILAGSRRYRAAQLAGLASMPAVIRDIQDDVVALELAVTENLQREDVHPLDEAHGYQALLKAAKKGHTVASVAARVGKSESYVYRRLALLKLADWLQAALGEDRLDLAHAELLASLTPAQQEDAADVDTGVVWRRRPLLDDEDDQPPTREDLRPLAELRDYIRTRTHFDPSARDLKHFQPALAAAIEESLQEALPSDRGEPDAARLVELTTDTFAKQKLGAGPNDPLPLTPSKWREVKSAKDRCPFTVRGVITHGADARVLEVCTKRSCAKHFPPAKKTKADAGVTSRADTDAQRKAKEQREREAREQAEQEWKDLRPALFAAFAKHTAKVKVDAALVRTIVSAFDLKQVKEGFGVTLSDATAAHVLLLSQINTHWRPNAEAEMQTFGFDVKGFTKAWKAERAAEGKAKLDTQRKQLAKGEKKGGRK